jgi:type I restriction enzyme R subunit
LIRRFKNEAFPNVAVTVELLSTGVDVPAIGNIVFLRRMNSRILYDQMIGRATRLCEPIGKSHFRIFDAVGIYNTLQPFSQMRPVVVNPSISSSQLLGELSASDDPDDAQLIRQQLVAKLRRKRGRLRLNQVERLRWLTGEEPEAFINRLQGLPIEEARRWVAGIEGLGELLDEPWEGPFTALMISEHEDALHSIVHGYGDGKRPEDYLEGFTAFVKDPGNDLPALILVLQRPWELTRKDLRELKLALDGRGYNEATLATAWRETTNQDMAASIMVYIRQAALGDPLVPYEQRVEKALQTILASRSWTTPQLDHAAAVVVATHRQPDQGDPNRGSGSAGRRPAVLQAGSGRLAAAEPGIRRRAGWGAAEVPAGGMGGVRRAGLGLTTSDCIRS